MKASKELIKNLAPMNRCLLGEGYDNALEYIGKLLKLEILEFKSGTKFGTWTVPDEWIVKDAWVKNPKGKKIIDYKKNPLSLVVGSTPVYTRMELEDFKKKYYYDEDNPELIPYMFNYYPKMDGNDWGFCVKKTDIMKKLPQACEGGTCVPELKEIDPDVGKIQIEGEDYSAKWESTLKKGKYEVKIDTEYKPGVMKLGVHTIPGDEKEILLFAHLDHPFQANDNLSGVACLVEAAKQIKSKHTIKIIFCPETIGSIAYAMTEDISNVEFVIAVDICGNDDSILLNKTLMPHKLNDVAHLAVQAIGQDHRKGLFRSTIGSDEYVFNDPEIGVPGIMLSRHPYKEYHSSGDTEDKINYTRIEEMVRVVKNIIEYWEKDFIPVREFKGPLHRSKYDIQSFNPQYNLSWDYLIYSMDGEKSVAELCTLYGLNFELTCDIINKMVKNGDCSINTG